MGVAIGLLLATHAAVRADIAPDQVLVVYNAAAVDATQLANTYLAAHPDIPATNVLELNDAALNVSDLSYANFISRVRDPIRNHILTPGFPEAPDIVSIVLIRPFPHRVLDHNLGAVGDNPNAAFGELLPPANGGTADATFAALDAELVLLWQDLDATEAGGPMDSYADNVIDNPYHMSTDPIDLCATCGRSRIQVQKTFTNLVNIVWLVGGAGSTRLTPGDMILVSRIDGNSLADAESLIWRSQDLYVNRALVRVLMDEYNVVTQPEELDDDGLFTSGDPFLAGDDYEETLALLTADGWDVRYDDTFDFIDSTEETAPLIAYASYGENHSFAGRGENPPGSGTFIDNFDFAPGAIFNTVESYNGRALNGLGTLFTQEQVADFVAAGGTFSIGHVFEPFSFTLPDNEFLFTNMLVNQMQWGEAAYTSLPVLSWQHVVIGDPLAYYNILDDPGLPKGDLDGNGSADGLDISLFVEIVLDGTAAYRTTYPTLDPIARADFTGDFQIDTGDTPGFVAAILGP